MIDAIRDYLKHIEQALKAGNATEHTHRPALEALLEALGGPGTDAINEPARIACGAPDFIVTRGVVPLGYVEAKDVGVDLDKVARGEQLAPPSPARWNCRPTSMLPSHAPAAGR